MRSKVHFSTVVFLYMYTNKVLACIVNLYTHKKSFRFLFKKTNLELIFEVRERIIIIMNTRSENYVSFFER